MISTLISETFTRPGDMDSTTGKPRIKFIDLAKGVCILMVIMVHMETWRYLGLPFINQMLLPLYFLLSGLFFKDYGGWFDFLIKRSNKLLVPFFAFYVIGCIALWLIGQLSPLHHPVDLRILDLFKSNMFPNNPIWFLLALFWINLFFITIWKITTVEWQRGTLVVALAVAGYLMRGSKEDFSYFLFFNSALMAIPFFYLGYCLRRTTFLLPNRYDRYNWWISIGMIAACAVALYLLRNPKIIFHDGYYMGNPVASYLISVLAVLAVLLICKQIEWLPFISYFGRYSIIPLLVHSIYIELFRPVVKLSGIHWLGQHMILFLIVVLVCWPTIHVVKKYLPYISAQKDIIPSPKSRHTAPKSQGGNKQ